MGWSWPCAWPGWVVLVGWLGLAVLAAGWVGRWPLIFVPVMLLLGGGLFAVAWWKGDPAGRNLRGKPRLVDHEEKVI